MNLCQKGSRVGLYNHKSRQVEAANAQLQRVSSRGIAGSILAAPTACIRPLSQPTAAQIALEGAFVSTACRPRHACTALPRNPPSTATLAVMHQLWLEADPQLLQDFLANGLLPATVHSQNKGRLSTTGLCKASQEVCTAPHMTPKPSRIRNETIHGESIVSSVWGIFEHE
jgi:hypothetical protein